MDAALASIAPEPAGRGRGFTIVGEQPHGGVGAFIRGA